MRVAFTITAGLALAALTGCPAAHKEPVYPVKGQLYYREKPAGGAVVWLYPADAPEINKLNPGNEVRPTGIVQEDGSFELSTYGVNDGAPAGRYKVTVMWNKKTKDGKEESVLSAEYLDPNRSGLPLVEVKELAKGESNVLPPFKLAP
jgi:hypothetical protein